MKSSIRILCILVFFGLMFSSCGKRNKDLQVSSKSDEALVLFEQARDEWENVEIKDALKDLEDALLKDNTFAAAYLYKGVLSPLPNESKAAIQSAEQLLPNIPEGEQLLLKMDKASFYDKDYSTAKGYGEKLLSMYPEDKHILMSMGIIYYNLGDYNKSIDYYKQAVKIDPEYGPGHNMLGICYFETGRNADAEKEFKEYLRIASDRPNSYDSYAWFLERTGKLDQAIENYNKALQYDDSFVSSLTGSGKCYILKGDYTKARDTYKKYYTAAETGDGRLNALRLVTLSYIYENKLDLALKNNVMYRDQAAKEKIPSEIVFSYAYEGLFLSESGKTAEGVKKFEEAFNMIDKVDLPKDEKEQLHTIMKIPLAYAYCMNNDLKKAKEYLQQFEAESGKIKMDGREDNINLISGLMDLKEGNPDAMIEHYKKVEKPDAQDKYNFAQAYIKKGDKESAKKLLSEILASYDDSNQLAAVWNKTKKDIAGL